ncbi:hypothetical protein HXX76_014084 [Chlamydomonas incerta]|uniref:Uncharacterized protein n=1 Tax=Chlamydomonas incerta TaxID=51695 RepID=A0A835SS61_CHLIN|nr:hypothetical protein HXX76_014084 [Chlamydomonas incerta]|eukprot:KAG2424926.1 hypothetical protein HXX76_014084 [Chlamydomonas incerta]
MEELKLHQMINVSDTLSPLVYQLCQETNNQALAKSIAAISFTFSLMQLLLPSGTRAPLANNEDGTASDNGDSIASSNEIPADNNEIVAVSSRPPRLPSRGHKVQKYDLNLALVATLPSSIEAVRLEGVSVPALKLAIANRTAYKGFRWAFLERAQPDDTVQDIGPTVENRQYRMGLIAMLNCHKTVIVKVYPDQLSASLDNGLSGCAAISAALRKGNRSAGHYFKLFEDCSEELKAAYLRDHQLPEPAKQGRGTPVNQINAASGEVVKVHPTIQAVVNEFRVSRISLQKAITTGDVLNGFNIKSDVDAQRLTLAALTAKQATDVAAINNTVDVVQGALSESIGSLRAQTTERFQAVGTSVQAVNASLTDLIGMNKQNADVQYSRVVDGVQALLNVLRAVMPPGSVGGSRDVDAAALGDSNSAGCKVAAPEKPRDIEAMSPLAGPRLYNLRFHGSLSEMKFPVYTMKSAIIARSVTKAGSGALHVMTGDNFAYLVANKGVTAPGARVARFNVGFSDEIAMFRLAIPNIAAEVTEDNAQEYINSILEHNNVTGFGGYSVEIENLVFAISSGSGCGTIVALASYTGNGRNVADATLQYTVSVYTANTGAIAETFKGRDFKVTPLPTIEIAHPQVFFNMEDGLRPSLNM